MNYKIIVPKHFATELKDYVKKFPSLKEEIKVLIESLIENPKQGNSLGSGLYKIRLANKSKGTGKSGGFRVITYLLQVTESGTNLYLVTIYDKSEEESIDKRDLLKLVKTLII